MNLQQRVKTAAQALTGKTENSLGVSEANRFLRYGNGQKPLIQNWSEVKMSDEDMYTGYSYAAIVKRANRTSVVGRRFIVTDASQKTKDRYAASEQDLIHPYLQVVNRSKDFTKKQFWYEISTYLDLEGVYYLGTVRNSTTDEEGKVSMVGAVQKFILTNPYEMRKVINETTGEVGGYVESHNGFYREWAPEQIIEIKMLNPFNKEKPYAMTDAAKESQFTLKQAGDYTRQTMQGNIASPGIITTDVLLDDQKFENFKARVTGRQKDEPIFGNGAGAINWQDMQIDLDKAALDKVNSIQRDILLAVASMSKTTAGIEESGTTRDTSETQDENFTVDAIIPRVEDICDALNLDYRKWYVEWEENEFEIVVDNPLESDRDAEQADVLLRESVYDLATKLIDAGYDREASWKYAEGTITWEELGEPEEKEIPAQLQPYAGATSTPATDAPEEGSITDTESDTAQPEKKSAPSGDAAASTNAVVGKANNQISSRDFPNLYDDMDIDTSDLGCIMLDVAPVSVLKYVPNAAEDLVDETEMDYSNVPGEDVSHITLLYGLLENGNAWSDKVDQLLNGWKPGNVQIEKVDFFELPDSYAVIGHIKKTPELVDGHERLTLLPHISTFSEYLPHMTFAYITKDSNVNKWVAALGKIYNGYELTPTGINYGDEDEEDADDDSDQSNNDTQNKVTEASLSSVGQDHHAVSPAGLIVAYNDLDSSTRDIIKSQENKLKDGISNIELRMVETAMNKVTKNFLDDEGDVVPQSDQNQFEKELAALLILFYTNLFPIFGKQLLSQRGTEYGVVVPYSTTKEAQKYIKEMADKASVSHIETVTSDILHAAQAAYYDATVSAMVDKIQQELAAGNESISKMLPSNPTKEQIKSAVERGKFNDMSIYKEAQKLAQQGAGRAEIVRSIRQKYQDISKNRATTIARTESARVFNQSQYEADKQFLTNSGLMGRAYKKLRSRTGTPCVYCEQLIAQPPIPFTKNFADLGTTLKATETKEDGTVKVKTLPVNWESISAGNVHPNCNCEYVLIIK